VEKRRAAKPDQTFGMIGVMLWLHANGGVVEGLPVTDDNVVPALFASFDSLADNDGADSAA
jgi:hypothetical protein